MGSGAQYMFRTAAGAWSVFERRFAAAVLGAMVVLPLADSVYRKIVQASLTGISEYVTHGTLWIAFAGASLAAREGTHLRLAIGRKQRETRLHKAFSCLQSGLAAAVALGFAAAAFGLVRVEFEHPFTVAPFLPTWLAQIPMVLFMTVIAVRFVVRAGSGVRATMLAVLCAAGLLCLGFVPWEQRAALLYPALAVLVAAVLTGTPLFVFMGGLALFLFFRDGMPLSAVPAEAYRIVSSPILPTIPLFTLAGCILAEGGASQRLVALFRAQFGWLPGGIAIATVALCAFFTTFTGASSVTILALGGLLFPVLLSGGYPEKFSLGLITASGSVGILFPPALPIIIYGVVAAVPIDKMFLAGLTPGCILVGLMVLYGLFVWKREEVPAGRFSIKEFLQAANTAKWDMLLPVLVAVGIFGGFTTIVEAAAMTALYAVIVECFIHRKMRFFTDLPKTVVSCARLVGGVMIILGCAFGLTNYLIDAEVPKFLFSWIRETISSRLVFLLAMNVFLVAVGCIMDIFSAIVVIVPILIPVAQAYDISPIHLGIIFLVNLELGYLTPPVGLNLFFSAYRFNKPLSQLYATVLPFLGLRLVVVLLVTYVPLVSLWIIGG